jgi:hypothetical protein
VSTKRPTHSPKCGRIAIAMTAGLVGAAVARPLAAQVPAPFDVTTGNVFRGAFTPDGSEFYFFSRVTAAGVARGWELQP